MRRKLILPLILIYVVTLQAACGPSTLSKLHDSLNKVAKSLNAAAKTNHSFYEGGVYGVVGSDAAIATRAKAATVIHDANEKLILALNLAQQLTPTTFEQGKIAVLSALADAAAMLKTGNVKIDLVLQAVAVLITSAVTLIESFKSAQLRYVLPEIRTWRLEAVNA